MLHKAIDRLQTLSQEEENPIAELDIDIWGSFIARDIRDYAEKAPAGLVVDLRAMKQVL